MKLTACVKTILLRLKILLNLFIKARVVSSTTVKWEFTLKAFAAALRGALREDPDIILVGEMRDLETISLAVEAASTGHLVFATVHTTSAPKTVDRIIEVFPATEQLQIRSTLADGLRAVISQVLFKRIDIKARCVALEILIANSCSAQFDPRIKNLSDSFHDADRQKIRDAASG